MKLFLSTLLLSIPLAAATLAQDEAPPIRPVEKSPDLDLVRARVVHRRDLDLLVFELEVAGRAGATVPAPRGSMKGAPVLGYVFPTTLKSTEVGFGEVEGVVALAVTSHPDFDDTPLWDEDGSRDYGDDGKVFHPHWVVLVPDERVPGGLAVRQFAEGEKAVLPPTNPGMPMYMDSPGFSVVLTGNTLRVLVPAWRVAHRTDFRFDGVSAYMQVMPGVEGYPMLGVYEVYEVLSGDLSLPFAVEAVER